MEDLNSAAQTIILPDIVVAADHHLPDRDRAVLADSMLCVPGAKLIPSALDDIQIPRKDDVVLFVNAGGGHDPFIGIEGDSSYSHGGDVLTTQENIAGGGKYSALYQSARFGDFSYKFDGLSPGDYCIDLHFAEIININGPKGMRVFDVIAQDEKILSMVDIYALVGANKPLQVTDIRVSAVEDGSITLRFIGVCGSPSLCGVCIRKTRESPDSLKREKSLVCENCASTMELSSHQNRSKRLKSVEKCEEEIQELTSQYQLKSEECYQAWMLLTDANNELVNLKMELDSKLVQSQTLDHSLRELNETLKKVSVSYEKDRKYWLATICDLEGKIKIMKKEYAKLSFDAHDCANSIPELSKMIFAVQDLVTQCDELKLKYNQEQLKRRRLHNQLQDMKGNIRVFCRCRPLNNAEISIGSTMVVDFEAAKDGDLGLMVNSSNKKTFKFDRVYSPKDDQVDVYMDASPLVTSVLDGYNVCIFAYGQTGTGKTFTMEGNESNRGVNYRTLEELFKIAKERKESFTYDISVSVLEVYNEQIRDLLATTPPSKRLEVKQGGEGTHVPGIVDAKVENIREVWEVLQAGSSARAVGSNNVNEHSSRSHCMLCIMVRAKNLISGECTKSKLWLVDLAGSERLAKTDVQGERLKEAQNINRSLSALGDVISALATKNNHIPYRNSKLTHLLQDSLGGDSKVLMLVQISPSDNDLSETLSSLNFASRVRGIELGPARKQLDTGELLKMKQSLDKMRQDSRTKDEKIRDIEETCSNLESKINNKDQLVKALTEKLDKMRQDLRNKDDSIRGMEENFLNVESKINGKELLIKNLTDKIKELEGQLQSSLDSQRSLDNLSDKLKWKEEHCMALEHKVKELEYNLWERQKSELHLEQKVKDLEIKLRDQSDCIEVMQQSASKFRVATPVSNQFLLVNDTREADSNVLRCSDSLNRVSSAPSQSSILLRGPDSLNEVKRKRGLGNGTILDTENVNIPSTFDHKNSIGDMNKTRKIDPVKAYGRFVKTTKVAPAQRPYSLGRIVSKENKRGWH